MKAVLLEKPHEFKFIDIPEPTRPGPGEALLRVHRIGICGSDTGGYLGKMPFYNYPCIPGHELGVDVLEVGPGVTNVKPGDRCSVEPYMNCGKCIACRKGAVNCCITIKTIGVMLDGGMREKFILRADKLHPSRSLTHDQLALVEMLAIGCHAVNRGNPQKGENVLVIGAGPIGLSAVEFVRLAGARTIVMDISPQRLDLCRRMMGVTDLLTAGENVEQELRRLCGGDLPDLVIDATGNSKSMAAAMGYIAPTGRLVYVGISLGEVTFKHTVFHRPEGTLLCSRNALPADFSRIIHLMEQGRINTDPWITHRAKVDDIIGAFPTFTKPESGVLKAMIEIP